MPAPNPLETLIALALDLLAHTEAQYREARRLDGATQILAGVATAARSEPRQTAQLHEMLQNLRQLSDVQRTLVDDFQQQFDAWKGSQA